MCTVVDVSIQAKYVQRLITFVKPSAATSHLLMNLPFRMLSTLIFKYTTHSEHSSYPHHVFMLTTLHFRSQLTEEINTS